MGEEIQERINYLKNLTEKDVIAPRYIKEIEEYINNLIFIIKKQNESEMK